MEKNTLVAIGEALIDFIPAQTGCSFAQVESFSPKCGGAPANVCGAYTCLGGKSRMITQLGNDPFGHKIADELEENGIDISCIPFTDEANTALAFVSLAEDGNRTFSFYRKPSADMLLTAEQVKPEWFADAYALHFCSVSLGDFPMKEAHRTAIACARGNGALISFDPNLRFPLWKDEKSLYDAVWDFIPLADVLKVSDEELYFLTHGAEAGKQAGESSESYGKNSVKMSYVPGELNISDELSGRESEKLAELSGESDEEKEFLSDKEKVAKAIEKLFVGNVKLVIFTCGSEGAYAYTRKLQAFAPSQKVKAVDTTGAGDGFIGSFLYALNQLGITPRTVEALDEPQLTKCLDFSNRSAGRAYSIMGQLRRIGRWSFDGSKLPEYSLSDAVFLACVQKSA